MMRKLSMIVAINQLTQPFALSINLLKTKAEKRKTNNNKAAARAQ
jgi:hypothetical protein